MWRPVLPAYARWDERTNVVDVPVPVADMTFIIIMARKESNCLDVTEIRNLNTTVPLLAVVEKIGKVKP